jgi:hypothetical protein
MRKYMIMMQFGVIIIWIVVGILRNQDLCIGEKKLGFRLEVVEEKKVDRIIIARGGRKGWKTHRAPFCDDHRLRPPLACFFFLDYPQAPGGHDYRYWRRLNLGGDKWAMFGDHRDVNDMLAYADKHWMKNILVTDENGHGEKPQTSSEWRATGCRMQVAAGGWWSH